MNLLVVEEEKNIVEEIRGILGRIDDSINIVGVTRDVPSVSGWLKEHDAPDLILINEDAAVQIKGLYQKDAKAVITFSADDESYQFEAFRLTTMKEILTNISGDVHLPEIFSYNGHHKKNGSIHSSRERFLVKQGQRLFSVHINDIAYFFPEGRFIFFKTTDNQKYLTEYRIEQLESMLPPGRFFRINRSFIVSLAAVKQIHAWFGNRLKLYLEPNAEKEIIVSRERVKSFKTWLGK